VGGVIRFGGEGKAGWGVGWGGGGYWYLWGRELWPLLIVGGVVAGWGGKETVWGRAAQWGGDFGVLRARHYCGGLACWGVVYNWLEGGRGAEGGGGYNGKACAGGRGGEMGDNCLGVVCVGVGGVPPEEPYGGTAIISS